MSDSHEGNSTRSKGALISIIFIGSAVLGLTLRCNSPNEEAVLPPAAEYSVPVGRLIDAWVGMWNAYDLDQVRNLFLDDARVTYFSSEREGLIRGIDAVVVHHEDFGFVPGGKDQPNRLWLEDLNQEGFDSTVVVAGIWFFRPDPDQPPRRGPVTFVCVRNNGGWRFAHLHFANYSDPT